MSWHTQYRPTSIADLHLTSVRSTFEKLLSSGKLPQVFLFAGPKGTGKTSTSRIIAAMVNDPANEAIVDQIFFDKKAKKGISFQAPDASKPDAQKIFTGASYLVQEMDAASNRGIDDVRALKEKVYLPPQDAKMAVYILDEAHMLTREAFNALLKLLEEPPSHAIFILATTELHKIPETITSRATMVRFQKASVSEIVVALEKIVAAEKLTADDEALSRIATLANGSFRDAVKLLETVAADTKHITLEVLSQLQLSPLESELTELLQAVVEKDEQAVVRLIEGLRQQAYPTAVVHQALLQFLHDQLLISLELKPGSALFNARVTTFLLDALKTLPKEEVSPINLLTLELSLLEIIFRAKKGGSSSSSAPSSSNSGSQTTAKSPKSSSPVKKTLSVAAPVLADVVPSLSDDSFISDNLSLPDDGLGEKLLGMWDIFVSKVAEENATVAALLQSAKPLPTSNGKARVAVYYQFHKDQLQQPKFMSLIQACAEPLLGGKPGFEFVVEKMSAVPDAAQPTETLEVLADQALM